MKRKIAVVVITMLLLTTFVMQNANLVWARPRQVDPNRLMAVSRKMHMMAQAVSKEYAAETVTHRNVPSPEHDLKPALGLAKEVFGYYTEDWQGDTNSLNSLNSYGTYMAGIATFSFQLQSDGRIKGSAPSSALQMAHNAGAKSMALIHNYNNSNFDRKLVHSILNSQSLRNKTVSNILNLVKTNGYDGVNVDFENVPSTDKEVFNKFIILLSRAMHQNGFVMTISVPAKTSNDLTGWGGAFDYKTIGQNVDRVMLMTYDEHWFGSSPGAVASSPWVEQVIRYAVNEIPAEKVVLGIGVYGYDWITSAESASSALSSARALQLMARYGTSINWDDVAQVPFYYYKSNGITHVVWFESNESAAFKMNMVNKYNLAGISVWRLGFEANGFWQTVGTKFAAN